MLKRGQIRKSTSPAASLILFVPKKNKELRLVVNYQRINDLTIKNRYLLPNIEESKNRLIGANWFSKIDLRDAFYSIRMAEGEEWKTAFRTRYGLYEFLVMPIGLTNALATCQDVVNETLRDLLDITVLAYIDDILIFTKGTLDQHKKDVLEVFKRLDRINFRTALEKCEFLVKRIEFLGFIIEEGKIRMDSKKAQLVTDQPMLENVRDV